MILTNSPTIKTKKMNTRTTPTDLTEYLETHYEISSYLALTEESPDTLAQFTRQNEGIGGLYELAKKLTDQFTEETAGTQWVTSDEADYFETLGEFMYQREQEHRRNIQHENDRFRILTRGTTYAVQYVADGYIAQYFPTLAEAKKYIGAK